jgi:hypothetical protein
VKAPVAERGFVFDREVFAAEWPKWTFLTPSTVLLRTERVRAIGGFAEGLSHCEDYEFFLRYVKDARVAVVELPLVAYYRYSGQMSADLVRMNLAYVHVALTAVSRPQRYHPRSVETLRKYLPIFTAEASALRLTREPAAAMWGLVTALRASRSRRAVLLTVARAFLRRSSLRHLRRLPVFAPLFRSPAPHVRDPWFVTPWRETNRIAGET